VRKHRTNKSRLYFRAIDCCNQFHARLQFLCYTKQRYRSCACKNRLNRIVCCVLLGTLVARKKFRQNCTSFRIRTDENSYRLTTARRVY